MIKLKKLIDSILCLSLLCVMASIILGVYLFAFHENPPIVLNDTRLAVNKQIYYPGDTILVIMDYCRITKVPVTRYVSFSDGVTYDVPPYSSAGGDVGCRTRSVEITKVPSSLPSGKYFLFVRNEYRVNFIATRYVDWRTVEFEIINK